MKKRLIKHPERRNEHGQLLRADGQIDRRRPPKEMQYKPGQSGYPQGRPKGKKNTDTMIRDVIDGNITLHVRGREKKISIREAIIIRIVDDALKGDTKAAAFLLNRYEASTSTEQPDGDGKADQEILAAYIAQVTKGNKK